MVLLMVLHLRLQGTIVAAIIQCRRGEGINYYGLSHISCRCSGSVFGILMLHSLGYDFIIAFCVALIILCGIGSVIMKFNEPKLDIDSEEHKGIKISDYIEPRMNSISLVSVLVGLHTLVLSALWQPIQRFKPYLRQVHSSLLYML